MKRGGGRPKDGYYLVDGTRVPSVTTITGHFKGGALIQWAYNQGKAGKELYGERDEAAAVGSVVHDWIEQDLYAPDSIRVFPDGLAPEKRAEVEAGYAAYRQWRQSVNLEILETEVPLVSEKYGYGGTLDAIVLLDGERVLFDWKTSGGTYPDYIAQVAAYRQLVNEAYDTNGDGSAVTRGYLLRVGKEFGDFHLHFWPESVLNLGWQWFTHAHGLYAVDKRLKKVAT